MTAEQKVCEALEANRALLSLAEYQEVSELNGHAEWGVAAEFLADFLIEKDAEISDHQYSIIRDAFLFMNMSDSWRIQHLEKLIRNEN